MPLNNPVIRPWGSFADAHREQDIVCKRIVINPGHAISYQRHMKRGEFWYILSGEGQLKHSLSTNPLVEYSVIKIGPGSTIEIPSNMAHQLICYGDEPLILWEMQFGDCSEEDIERLHDNYGRN